MMILYTALGFGYEDGWSYVVLYGSIIYYYTLILARYHTLCFQAWQTDIEVCKHITGCDNGLEEADGTLE